MWQPRINTELFVKLSDKEYVNIYTGEIFTNRLSVQILSDIFTRQQKGTATNKQLYFLKRIGASSQDIAEWKASNEKNRDIVDESESLRPYIDYVPDISQETPDEEKQWELAYNNFLSNLANITSPELMEVVKEALERLNQTKWAIGRALNDMPQDILYYIGYGGYGDSSGASIAFASDLLNYLPIDERERAYLENEIQDLSYEDF